MEVGKDEAQEELPSLLMTRQISVLVSNLPPTKYEDRATRFVSATA